MNSKFLADKYISIDTESLADKVYAIIETSILNMEFQPGTLLNEDDIATTLKVSRSPVREALLKLEHVGLVEKNRKSRVVASITEEKIVNNYQMWSMTESFAAGLACKTASAGELETIGRVLDQMEQNRAEMEVVQYRELNYLFHTLLVAPCPNQQMVEYHKNALNHIRWGYNYTLLLTEDIGKSNREHNEIFTLYRDRDRMGLEGAIRGHIEDVSKRLRAEYLKHMP